MRKKPALTLRTMVVCAMALLATRVQGDDDESPDTAGEARGIGDMAPLAERDLRLVSATVRLRVGEGGAEVSGEYVVSNRGPERVVALGVPTSWETQDLKYNEDLRDKAQARGALVRLVVAGKSYTCSPASREEVLLPRDPHAPPLKVNVWCVAKVVMPKGDAIPLSLQYRDQGSGDWQMTGIDYVVAGGGRWNGRIKHVRVDLESPSGKMNLVWPPGAMAAGESLLRWEGENVDPSSLGAFVIEWSSRPRGDVGWIRADVELAAEASSELQPQGKRTYRAANSIDDDPATAWCEGAPGAGVGEWIAIRLRQPKGIAPGQVCGVRDIRINPGYGRDDGTFAANGKVRKARIEECRSPESGAEVDLAPAPLGPKAARPKVKNGAQIVAVPDGWHDRVPECIRMKIKDVELGKYEDTCVSEFIPRVFCKAKVGL